MNVFRRVILTLGLAIRAFCLKLFLCGSLGELACIGDSSDLLTALARRERNIRSEMSLLACDPEDYEVMEVRLSSVTSWIKYLHYTERIRDLWN